METLLKLNKAGKTCIWKAEISPCGTKYRVTYGQDSGNLVTSKWTEVECKNSGRSNATSKIDQVKKEVLALYTKKIKEGYVTDPAKVSASKPYFEPMLCISYKDIIPEILCKDNWSLYIQPKLDGIRAIIDSNGIWSRRGNPILSVLHLNPLMTIAGSRYILDGELYSHSLRENFNKIVSLVKKQSPSLEDLEESKNIIKYHIYDIFVKDQPLLCFEERLEILREKITESDSIVITKTKKLVKPTPSELQINFSTFLKAGYEGMIIRRDAPYENKRSKNLIKMKDFIDKEYQIIDIHEGVGNRSGMAGKIEYQMSNGKTFSSGIEGGEDFYKNLLKNKKKFIGGEGTVRYFSLTPDGKPRFPVTVAVYEQKRNI